MKKFLYLIQGRKNNVLKYTNLKNDNSDVITLTFDEEIFPKEYDSLANIFFPKSTWAEGRNKQLEYAKLLPYEYLYYIFIDDDVEFIQGSFREFEQKLIQYRPQIGFPLLTIVKHYHRYNPKLLIQRPTLLDTQITAFHIDTIKEGILMPLVTLFDDKSWFYSCEIINFLILSDFKRRVIQFNDIIADNVGHCWDEKTMKAKDPHSNYVGGTSEEIKDEVRKYIVKRFGDQPRFANTLFHDKSYRNYIDIPRGKDFLFSLVNNSIRFRIKHAAFLLISYLKNKFLYNYPKELELPEILSDLNELNSLG